MIPAPAKLSAAVVIQSSGVALVQGTLSAYAAGAGPQQRGGPAVEEHGHDEDGADDASG
jgi:hypothetical protein